MSEHTPGPWKTWGTQRVRAENAADNGSEDICHVFGEDSKALGNLILISSVTDLLAALEKAVASYGKPGGPWNVPNEPGEWLDMAKRAIEKAKGGGE